MTENQNPTTPAAIVIDTPEGIAMAHLLTVAHGLALEINTSMKMSARVSALSVAQRAGYTVKRTKKGALKDCVALIKANHPDPAWVPSGSIARAIG